MDRALRSLQRGVLAAILLLMVAACSSTTESSQAKVDIAPGIALRLPEHHPFGADADVIQLVQAVYKDNTQTFQAIIHWDSAGMSLIMTVPDGPRIMSFEWRGKSLNTKLEPIAPKGLSAEHMLADIITIYAPAKSLAPAIEGGALVVKPDGTREILKAQQPVIRVTYPSGSAADPWNGRAVLENLAFGYRLEIKSRMTPR
jgi:Protein of unknown function (DUF3261)